MGGGLSRISTGRKVTIAALTLIAIQVVVRGWFIGHSWFLVDDFLFLSDIARGHDDFAWYTRIHQGHFMPLSFALVKVVASIGAFNWTAAAIEIIVMQLIASVACWIMLRTLFGARPAVLLGLGFYLFSPLTMPSIMWWAVAINQLPHQIACFGAIAAHVMFCRSRRWAPALAATGFLLIGYASYTKTLLLPVVLVMLTLSYFSSGHAPRRTWDALRNYRRAWGMYAALTAAFVVVYVRSTPETVSGKRSTLFGLSQTSVLESFGTSAVGGPWRWSLFGRGPISYAAAPEIGIVVAWLLIVAFVVWAWARSDRTLRVLWIPAFYIGASILLVYAGRAYVLNLIGSPQVGRHMQYISDAAPVLAVTIVCMIVPIVGAVEPVERRAQGFITLRLPRAVITVALAALLVGSLVSSIRYAQPWSKDFAEKKFTTSAREAIRRDHPTLADVAVPNDVLSVLFGSNTLIKNYFAPMGNDVKVTRTGTDLTMLDAAGRVVPADVDADTRTSADPAGSCPIKVQGRERTIAFTPVVDYPFWMAIEYTSNLDATIPLEYGIYRKEVPIENGKHTLFLSTTGAYDSVTLRPLVGQEICVDNIKVGQLVAAAKP